MRDSGLQGDLRVLLFPETAEVVEVGKLFANVLADLFLAVKRTFPDPAFDLVVHLIGQRFVRAGLVPLPSSLAFRSDRVGSEPSVTIKPDVLALGPVEALNVLPLGAKGA